MKLLLKLYYQLIIRFAYGITVAIKGLLLPPGYSTLYSNIIPVPPFKNIIKYIIDIIIKHK